MSKQQVIDDDLIRKSRPPSEAEKDTQLFAVDHAVCRALRCASGYIPVVFQFTIGIRIYKVLAVHHAVCRLTYDKFSGNRDEDDVIPNLIL